VGWVLQFFYFVIKHKSGKLNQGIDAISSWELLLFQLNSFVLGFEHLKSLYQRDSNFSELFEACQVRPKGDFMLQGGCLFKVTRLCVSQYRIPELILREVHRGSMVGHFDEDETYLMAKEH